MTFWKPKKKPRHKKVDLDARQELEELREARRNRFRILVCLDGSDAGYDGLKFAKEIGRSDECDIILLYVRAIDQGLRSGGLQMRVARENMLDWGLELPGIQYLKRGRDILMDDDQSMDEWRTIVSHSDVRGDPLGDNKIEYRSANGKSIVLKLKTAPDPASGILDQYELGPYNLMILGHPGRWRGELRSALHAGVAQKVAMMAPCSVLVAREITGGDGYLICSDGSDHCLDAVRRTAVLAQISGKPVTLMGVAKTEGARSEVDASLKASRKMLEEMGITTHALISDLGDPVERIIDSGKNFELIAVSDSGKSFFKRFLAGSVAFDVMGSASRSVLNVR